VDPLGLGYQSSGGFPYALSETKFSHKVAGYGYEHCNFPSVSAVVDACPAELFAHLARFDDREPICSTLRLAMDVHSGTPRFRPGSNLALTSDTWLKPFLCFHIPIRERSDAAIRCDHMWLFGATFLAGHATLMMKMATDNSDLLNSAIYEPLWLKFKL